MADDPADMSDEEKIRQEHKFFDHQFRYKTYEKALEGHEIVVTMVREGILP